MGHQSSSSSATAMAKPPYPPPPRRALSSPVAISPKTRSLLSQVMIRSQSAVPNPPSPPHQLEVVSEVAQVRSTLQRLGQRPDREKVDAARSKLRKIESNLSKKLQEIVLSPRPGQVDRLEWRAQLAAREKECRAAAEKEVSVYRALVSLDEMHDKYGKMLREAEERLVKVYESNLDGTGEGSPSCSGGVEVVDLLRRALAKSGFDRIDLSSKRLRVLPEKVFGSIRRVVLLNLSGNQLQAIPESISGLESLEELNISSNLLSSLPDSFGLFRKLRVLNVSGNKLIALPDSIGHCRSLVELDVSFNNLTYLPTNIGYELSHLETLSICYNKIRSIPTSICNMESLKHLDAHFNELNGVPPGIGNLTNLETLNLSSNFSDLTDLPDSIGDLSKLRELDLGSNQIQSLPFTFWRLLNLTKLNLDQNPLVVPPMEVVEEGVEAIRSFMVKRWRRTVVEEEEAPLKPGSTQHLFIEQVWYRCFQECFRGHGGSWQIS